MDIENEEIISKTSSDLPSNKTLTILTTTSLGLGLGLGLGFLYALKPQTLKPISTAIKVSEAALRGSKSLSRIRSPSNILFFSKVLIKISYAAAERFNCSPSLDTKRIKAYVGALNLVRYLRFPPVVGNGFLELGVLTIGYKLSKNFMKVLEGFLGIQFDSAFRKGVDAVGLFVKTTVVTREVSRIANSRGWKESFKVEEADGNCSEAAKKSVCRFARNLEFDCGVCWNFSGLNFHSGRSSCYDYHCLNLDLNLWGRDLNVESLETCFSDLLCLSIPVHVEIQQHLL